jgi:hypothetical protein
MNMRIQVHTVFLAVTLACLPSSVYADEDDTMMVVDEGATPEDIVKVIPLPVFSPTKPQENVAPGQEIADQAKQSGKELGRQIAEEAKSNKGSISDDVRQDAGREGHPNRGQDRRPGG